MKVLQAAMLAVALAGPVAACSAISGRETPGQYVDDTAVSTKVRAAIAQDPKLSIVPIDVETFQGVVQLSGFVDSQQEKARAGEVARNVAGVRDVKNNLIVRGASTSSAR